MAQRNSRKGGSKTKKRPELRTGGGRQAKSARSEQRRRTRERSSTSSAPVARMRPAGVMGAFVMFALGWVGVAIVVIVALQLDRWNILSYPDTLWLYVSYGVLAVAPAVGRVSRTVFDADSWGVQALLVPALLLAYEAFTGPGCPPGGNCAAIGARGALGLPLSFALVIMLAAGAWGLARWQQRAASNKRPANGRVRYSTLLVTMITLLVFPGAIIAASLLALDLWVRTTPKLVVRASEEVERSCYGLVSAPALAVRAAPHGYNPSWTTFAVRRANESRPGIGKKPLPTDWATLNYVYPYEATISFSSDGDPVADVACHRIAPGTGNAQAGDLEQPEPETNPMSPKTGQGSQFYPELFTNPQPAAPSITPALTTTAKRN